MHDLRYATKIFFKKNSATILTVAAAIGVVATSVTTAKAAIKADKLLEEAKEEKKEELTATEKIKVAAPSYILPVVIGASTIACIFGANILNKRQQAALASAYALISSSFTQYKDKVKELYGEETHNNIVNSIAKEKCKDVHINSSCMLTNCSQEFEDADSEPRLFYDEYSERYFETTPEKVLLAEYHLNRNFTLRGVASLNEFYEFLGLEPTEYGDVIGWSSYDEVYWIDFNHRKAILDDDLECYIIEMPYCPR